MTNAHQNAADALTNAQGVTIKVGSALVCDDDGTVRQAWLNALCADIARLVAKGVKVVVVSSGAMALGRGALGLPRDVHLDQKQAASASGQALLMEAWRTGFAPHKCIPGQILITLHDTEDRQRYLNARSALKSLLEAGAIPVVNENDTLATADIRYGDNDRLAAHAAILSGSDVLVILSDVDGYYTEDPRSSKTARRLDVVPEVTPEIMDAAGGANLTAGVGSGGMATKVEAARIAGDAGCATIIAKGSGVDPLSAIAERGPATLFLPSEQHETAWRKWIGGRVKASGRVDVDHGALNALTQGASLLPAGIVRASGTFSRGDIVEVFHDGVCIGQGLITYDAADLLKLLGESSEQIDTILGYERRPAAIERDDLVLNGYSERGESDHDAP